MNSGATPNRWVKRCAANGTCVEVGATADHVYVRDSEDPVGPWVRFTPAAWLAFARMIRND